MKPPPLCLYIHLPWCERKCPYCDFNSHEQRDLPQSEYVSALLQDFERDVALAGPRTINSIFIGGGTPSLFSALSIQMLITGVRERADLHPEAEITLEANPSSAEAEKFIGFREAGVNRLSLGVQSFDDACLGALGRVHNSEQAIAATQFAREAQFSSVNLDLMHGLPGQSPEAAQKDLQTALDINPDHLSWYQLTIEPNTVFYSKPPVLPAEEYLAEIQSAGEELLAGQGYQRYEVSAYARPKQRCKHNTNYWTFGDYIGIGAGAHGKISFSDGRVQRYGKRRQPEEYLSTGNDPFIASRRWLTAEEMPGEFVMNALRLREGFSLQLYRQRTGLDDDELKPLLQRLCDRGLLQCSAGRVAATDLGYQFLDSVIAEFFP